jgi:hypothetical protein
MVSRPEGHPLATDSSTTPADRIERLRFGERWMPDAWELFHVPGGFSLLLADMTQVKRAIRILRDAKIPATFPHLIVRAVALAYLRGPQAVQIICNYERITPGSFDVGLSMAGQTSYAPVVVIRAVDQKPLSVLIPAIADAVDAAAAKEAGQIAALYRLAVPFRWLRRWILSGLQRSFKFRTEIVGHFQVTCLNNIDVVVPLVFYSSAILGVGAIRDRVIARDGVPVVKPTVWLSGVAEHASTDGLRGGDALQVIKEILEGDELVREALEAAALKAAQSTGNPKLLPGAYPSPSLAPRPAGSSQDGAA